MNSKHYDAVVIGAGSGGIGAALALARAGLAPLVIEQNALPGGCAAPFVRGRFVFDTSLQTLACARQNDVSRLEREYGAKGRFIQAPPRVSFGYPDGKGGRVLEDFPLDLPAFIREASARHPGWAPYLQRYFDVCGQLAERSGESPDLSAYADLTVRQAMDRMEIPADLQRVLSTSWPYAGLPVRERPFARHAAETLACLSADSCLPEHTYQEYLAGLASVIREQGGEIWYDTEVTEIRVEGGAVRAVETDRGDTIETELVICNVPGLAGPAAASDGDLSFLAVYLGLDAPAGELGIRSRVLFISEGSAEETEAASYTRNGPRCMTVVCPNAAVPGFSPPGTCVLSIYVPMRLSAMEGLDQKTYLREKDRMAGEAVRTAGSYLDADLFAHIEEIEIATPLTFARCAALPGGPLGPLTADEESISEAGGPVKGLHLVGQHVYGIDRAAILTGIRSAGKMAGAGKEDGR